jgi:broad specificity phosphatase PhoE
MGSLFLARHATTEASVAGRNLGRRDDPPLAPAGRELASRLGHAMFLEIGELPRPGTGELRLIASSALRCRETADAVASVLIDAGLRPTAIESEPGLIEIDYGDWDGFTADESRRRDPELRAAWEADPHETRAPSGESGRDVALRSQPVFDEVEAWLADGDARCALVIAHNHVNRIRLCRLMGWPPRDYRDRVVQDPGGYSLITFPSGGGPSVVRRLNALPPAWPPSGRDAGGHL